MIPVDSPSGSSPMGPITFRRMTRADFERLATWLAEPHVHRWWHHEFTAEAVERDFGPTVDGDDPSRDYIVDLDGAPIGVIQWMRYADFPDDEAELTTVIPLPADARCVDYFIGDPALVGRGIGSAVIAAFVTHVWATDDEASCIVVPVCSANVASWRALQKAGFCTVARGDLEPDNPIDDPKHEILRLDRP